MNQHLPVTESPVDDAAEPYRHDFLGDAHDRNARKTRAVLLLCLATMAVELAGGLLFRSMALLADGLHMATHAGVMLVAAGAYRFARTRAADRSFSFGTGKVGDLAAFASAVALASTAIFIAIESVERLLDPVPIAFGEAIPIAVLGLLVNFVSARLLHDDHDHGHDHHHHHHGHDHHMHGGHHDHDHEDHHDTASGLHQDHNLRAAYIHVLSDAAVGLLAIIGLVAARALGWLWLDPLIGVIGAAMILRWAFILAKAAGGVLLDRVPDPKLAAEVRRRLEADGARLRDFHLWRLGPGHNGLIAVLACPTATSTGEIRCRLADIPTLSHVTIEIEPA